MIINIDMDVVIKSMQEVVKEIDRITRVYGEPDCILINKDVLFEYLADKK